jgi:SAM-dependent methyltransferase
MSSPPALFDRALRRVRRDRLARDGSDELETLIADDLCDRLESVQRNFASALVVNTGRGTMAARLRAQGLNVRETDHGPAFASATGALRCDEDRLPRDLGRFDLVVAPTGFDTVDDLPGALIAARLALNPGGMFLGCMIGAPSLPTLRQMANRADAAAGIAVARLHPQVDVRAAGDLLVRAGFMLPVADSLPLDLSYASVDRLIADLRQFGGSNAMADRHPATRDWYRQLREAFGDASGAHGRTTETVTLVIMTGWSPDA